MREYVIRRFTRWEDAARLEIDNCLWREPADVAAWGQLAWTDDALLVRLTAREGRIRAVERGPLGRPCEDSCLEFFLSPVPGDPRYINIEYNKNACCFLGLGDGRERVRLLPERDWFAPRTFDTPDGWGVEYRVPFQFLKLLFPAFEPVPGAAVMANCYKCGDLTEREHYLAWNPVASDTPDFHRPQDFGRMILQ